VCQFNGGLSEIPRCWIFHCVRICPAVVPSYLDPIFSVWNCDSEMCKWDPCDQVCLNFHVWFQLFIACLFEVHQILESRQNSGYSQNHQCWIIYSRLHKRIAVNFSTLLRQIQCSIFLIIHGWKECLSDIGLMYRILRHSMPISGLQEEFSWVFPCSGMNFRHTSNPLSCQGWWSQIWRRTHILFTSQFWQAATHY